MGFYSKMKAERMAKQANAADGVSPKYRVLQVDMLKQADREKAASIISFVQSDGDAYKLAGYDGFAYKDLDLRRRVGVVTYHGVEVALLFRREIVEREPGPADPVPETIIKDPAGAWIQIDLTNSDAVERRKGIGDRLSAALQQVQRLQLLWQDEMAGRKRAEELLAKVKGLKEEFVGLQEKVALLGLEKKATDSELESLWREVQQQKENRKTDKLRLVQEMFPVFNTVWLAGVHRHGDQLYDIIKKQLTEALAKVGVSFVEPKTGDQFDPAQHHAVHGVGFPEGAKEIGTVVTIHRAGWRLGGLVIEAADVAVGVEQKKEEKNADTDGTNGSGSGEEIKTRGIGEVGRMELQNIQSNVAG